MHWANAGTTATELRDKNALRCFLASGVRIDHVIRSHSALPFSSLSLPLAPAEDVPRAVILLHVVVTNFSCRRVFFSSVVVAVGDEAGRLLSFPGSAHHFEVGSGACNSRILDEMLPLSRKSEEIPV